MKLAKRIVKILFIAAFWFGIWALVAHLVGKPALFPAPWTVLARLWQLLGAPQFYLITLRSLWSVLLGILIAVLGGSLLAAVTAHVPWIRALLLPLMSVVKATPVASFIVLSLIWIGSASVPTFITLLIVLPVVWTNLDEGFSRIDPKLSEVARLYRFSFGKRLRLLTLPSLKPYFVSGCRTSLGLAWKAGIAAEIIAMPRDTIGTAIGNAKQYIEYVDVFAWTLTVILLSLAIEFIFASLISRLGEHKKRPARKEAAHAEDS